MSGPRAHRDYLDGKEFDLLAGNVDRELESGLTWDGLDLCLKRIETCRALLQRLTPSLATRARKTLLDGVHARLMKASAQLIEAQKRNDRGEPVRLRLITGGMQDG